MVITDHSTKGRLLVRKLKRQKCNWCFLSIANQHIYHQHEENLHLRKLYLQCWLFNGIEPWAVLSKLLLSLVTIYRRRKKQKSLAWTLGGMIVEIFKLNIGIKFVLPPIISVLAAKRSDLSSLQYPLAELAPLILRGELLPCREPSEIYTFTNLLLAWLKSKRFYDN